jgi:restriction system protein
MLPLLGLAADGQEHKTTDAIDSIADQLQLGKEDRETLLPSSTQTRLYNRAMWAVT